MALLIRTRRCANSAGFALKLKTIQESAGQNTALQALLAFDKKAEALEGGAGMGMGGGFGARGDGRDTLTGINGLLSMLMGMLQGADVAPTTQAVAAVADTRKALIAVTARWNELKSEDLKNLNTQLKAANLPLVEVKE